MKMADWFPFVGFKEEYIDEDGEPTGDETPWVGNVFVLEWFGRGVAIFVGKVRPAK